MASKPMISNHPNPRYSKPDQRFSNSILLLKICSNTRELHQIHATIIKTGQSQDISAINAIIELSATSNLDYAKSVFERVINPTQFTKNLIIRGHSQSQDPRSSIPLYVLMLNQGFEFNKFAFSFLMQACLKSQSMNEGKQIHSQMLKCGVMDAYLTSSIVRFYSENLDLDSARRAFESSREFVGSWNSMIDGYAKVGEIEHAQRLFDEMPQKTVISWTALLTGYVHLGRYRESLEVFQNMQKMGIKPDERTLASVLPSISHLGALSLGKWVHSYVATSGIEMNVFIWSALVDMYSKCGSIDDAIDVFEEMRPAWRNTVTWNAMICCLAMHGRGRDALEMFHEMLGTGASPTDVTFVGVLRACSHVGMVDEGVKYFEAMRSVYNIEPTIEIYGCMVDLLGRAGRLDEAERLASGRPDMVIFKTLLGACRVYGNVEVGERVGRDLIELAPGDSSCYVLLSNLYASVGRWEDVDEVRNLMRERGVLKIAGCSSIELDNEVHEFRAGEKSHPQINEIHAKVVEVMRRLKDKGYKPDTTQVLIDMDEEEKETTLYRHSEKLAIAFGLIKTTPGSTIRIVKNLRVCFDCHSATKFISELYDCEIIVRDQNRFHHFKNGSCSCNDYW